MKNILISTTLIFLSLAINATANDFGFFVGNKNYENVLIERVISATTFELESGEKISLIGAKGIKPPKRRIEKPQHDKHGYLLEEELDPTYDYEEKTYKQVKEWLEGKYVRLEFDSERKSADFKTLVYMFLKEDKIFVNAEILRLGLANLSLQPTNRKYNDELRKAYKEARSEFRGLHSQ